jgi:hypothetical protein
MILQDNRNKFCKKPTSNITSHNCQKIKGVVDKYVIIENANVKIGNQQHLQFLWQLGKNDYTGDV